METLLGQLKAVIDTLIDAPDLLLVCLLMIGMAFGIWWAHFLPNRLIPVVCMGFGACIVPTFLPVKLNPALSNPDVADYVRRVIVGALLGLVSLAFSYLASRLAMKLWPDVVRKICPELFKDEEANPTPAKPEQPKDKP